MLQEYLRLMIYDTIKRLNSVILVCLYLKEIKMKNKQIINMLGIIIVIVYMVSRQDSQVNLFQFLIYMFLLKLLYGFLPTKRKRK